MSIELIKILKNVDTISHTYYGIPIESQESRTIEQCDVSGLLDCPQLYDDIMSNLIVVNDGTNDLEPEKGWEWLNYFEPIYGKTGYYFYLFSATPVYEGETSFFGWHLLIDTILGWTANSSHLMSKPFYNGYVILNISNLQNGPITINCSGHCMNQDTGEIEEVLENISVTQNGYYKSTNTYIDAPTLIFTQQNATCDVEIYSQGCFDRFRENIMVKGISLCILPDSSTWNFNVNLYRIASNGEKILIANLAYSSSDEYPIAGVEQYGKLSRYGYDELINWKNGEALLFMASQSNIFKFDLKLTYMKVD